MGDISQDTMAARARVVAALQILTTIKSTLRMKFLLVQRVMHHFSLQNWVSAGNK